MGDEPVIEGEGAAIVAAPETNENVEDIPAWAARQEARINERTEAMLTSFRAWMAEKLEALKSPTLITEVDQNMTTPETPPEPQPVSMVPTPEEIPAPPVVSPTNTATTIVDTEKSPTEAGGNAAPTEKEAKAEPRRKPGGRYRLI